MVNYIVYTSRYLKRDEIDEKEQLTCLLNITHISKVHKLNLKN